MQDWTDGTHERSCRIEILIEAQMEQRLLSLFEVHLLDALGSNLSSRIDGSERDSHRNHLQSWESLGRDTSSTSTLYTI